MFTIKWEDDAVVILDQRRLPASEVYNRCSHFTGVVAAIQDMEIRGAPAIGVAAAMGIALAARNIEDGKVERFKDRMRTAMDLFAASRPTAVNLFWAIGRMKKILEGEGDIAAIREKLRAEALKIYEEDIAANREMGRLGNRFIDDGDTVMTHCNAGALATAGYGTALGVIRAAVEQGKKIKVLACETRPYLQGARLTAWELMQDGIDVTVITDNMSGHFMSRGAVNKVIVGADRIAANGDTANKIGTYMHSVLAREHSIPFYVAAPLSTLDPAIATGSDIPIEERSVDEVALIGDRLIVPDGVSIRNPSFDVTPAKNITAIITEKGIIEHPADRGIVGFLEGIGAR
jgi:methylthioribose-1-phosphate isomerase